MKKIFLLFIVVALAWTPVRSQTAVYHPFPVSNAFWGDKGWNIFTPSIGSRKRFALNGDTLIGSYTYKKVYSLYDSTLDVYASYYAAIREENKKIYAFVDNGSAPPAEHLLYDFTLEAGDTISYNFSINTSLAYPVVCTVTAVDSMLLSDGQYRKCWHYDNGLDIVEGIGSVSFHALFDPFWVACTCGDNYQVTCFKENDTAYYLHDSQCNHCFCDYLTGVNEIQNTTEHAVFPNPFSSGTTIRLSEQLKNAELVIYNATGQELKRIKNISGETITMSRGDLPAGIYFIRLTEKDQLMAADKLLITEHD